MALDIHAHRILILDFGSQYTQLIARRVREIGVYCELHPFDMDDEAIREFAPKGVILAGGPESVHEANSPRCPQAVFDLGVPVFGICYGMQTMAEQLGGKVEGSELREFGYARVDVDYKLREDLRQEMRELFKARHTIAIYATTVKDLNRDKQQTFERMINEEMADGEVGALDRKSTRLNSSHKDTSRMPSSA